MTTMIDEKWHDIYNGVSNSFWRNLAVAIVYRACIDYEQILVDEYNAYNGKSIEGKNYNRKELEAFFESEWFQTLVDIDSKIIVDQIRVRAAERINGGRSIGRDYWMSSLFED